DAGSGNDSNEVLGVFAENVLDLGRRPVVGMAEGAGTENEQQRPDEFSHGSLVRLARSAARHRESVAVSSPTSFGNCSSAFAFSDMKKSKPRGDHADSISLAATTSCPVHKLTSFASTSSDFQLSSSKRASSMRVRARISLRRPLVLSIFSNMLGSKPIFQQANQFFVRHQMMAEAIAPTVCFSVVSAVIFASVNE